jgi:hypothetical protein
VSRDHPALNLHVGCRALLGSLVVERGGGGREGEDCVALDRGGGRRSLSLQGWPLVGLRDRVPLRPWPRQGCSKRAAKRGACPERSKKKADRGRSTAMPDASATF